MDSSAVGESLLLLNVSDAHITTTEPTTRVVRIITRLNIGGPSIQAVSLSHRLEPLGFRTTLLYGQLGDGEGDMSYLLEGTGVDSIVVTHLERPIAPVADLRAFRQVYRVLCSTRPAIVHTHMAKAGTVGRAAALLYNRTVGRHRPARLVHTYHGHVHEGYFSAAKAAAFLQVERTMAQATDRIVAISPRIRDELVTQFRIGRPSQYVVVPLGFDLTTFTSIDDRDRSEARRELSLPAEAPVVTTIGRLTAIKQHDLFLRMAREVANARPRAIFLVVGDGELRGALERQTSELGLNSQVRFLGWRRDLATMYAATDVFALTSRNEGTPVALIEAMASGVPGVSTNVGGVGDVIPSPEIGSLVDVPEAAGLARAVVTLLDAPDRAAIGARARAFVRSRFAVDRLVRDIATLYRELLSQ